MAKGVKQYADDHDVTRSETIRRAVDEFLDYEGYPRDSDSRIAMTSGGQERKPVTRFLRFHAGLFGLFMWVGIGGMYLGAPFVSWGHYVGITMASAVSAATVALPLATNYPDHADRWLTYHAERQFQNLKARLSNGA